MSIEKFSGSFSKQDGGVAIAFTKTIQSITNFAALGLYMYLVSKPDGWNPNVKELMSHGNCGRDKIYSLLNYLIDMKLIKVEEIRNKGKFVKRHYTVMLSPFTENTDTAVQPFTDLPDTVNQHTYKEKNVEIIETHKKEKINKKEKEILPVEYPETYYPVPEDIPLPSTTKGSSFQAIVSNNPFAIPMELIEEWSTVRKAQKAPVTATVWRRINEELAKCPDPLEAFETMVERGWRTIKADWMTNLDNRNAYDDHSIAWISRVEETF